MTTDPARHTAPRYPPSSTLLPLSGSRHVTALTMTQHPTPASSEVSQSMVRLLWDMALDGADQMASIHERAEALLSRANPESPVVNWGLTDLHVLTRGPSHPRAVLVDRYAAWRAEVDRYEADPQGWMRHYFQQMVRDFAARYGPECAALFASRLTNQGVLDERDVPIDDSATNAGSPRPV